MIRPNRLPTRESPERLDSRRREREIGRWAAMAWHVECFFQPHMGALAKRRESDWLTVLPTQSASPAMDVSSPERQLLFAVLSEAVSTLRQTAGRENLAARRHFAETAAWFASDATDSPFAFASICDILGLDSAYLRSGLRRCQPARGEASCPSAVSA